ncbi:hypothetical protein QAD02_000889 [Eretmocerus hayati]|uniref:Uncharacterized protein n=1 Tax=Eretmocerus hayati TaxID=131215 RepID=A0ACC2NJA3_9HYME|nr:hypothetical protein QAD02_000889 [Eretmocerus hayati]
MYRICLQNYIIQRQRAATHGPKKFFKCYICHLELADDFGYVQQHIRSEEHLAKIGQINVLVEVLSILSTIPKSEQRVIVENAVTCSKNNPGSFYCHMCCCEVNELHKTLDHVRSDLHKENLRLKQLQKSQSMLELPAMKVEVCKAIVKGAPVQSSSKQGPISKKKIKSVFTHTRVCNLCNLSKRYLKNPMLVQCHVMQHLWKDIDFPLYSDILEFRWTDDKLIIKCLLCAYH